MIDFLTHLFVPHNSNNHRAKLLHHSSLLKTIALLLVLQVVLVFSKDHFSNVLGTTTDVSTQTLLYLTNKDRQEVGVGKLTINQQLSQAAYEKAKDMFAKNYWAHNSPDGTTPWVFIKKSGYSYVYAGENLARGFSTSDEVVKAWMASPSHRDNMLSGNYEDVGFAVLEGKLLGENTTLVVEEFGGQNTTLVKAQPEKLPAPNTNVRSAITSVPDSVAKFPLIDSTSLAFTLTFFFLSLFILVLITDMLIVQRRQIVRFVGHNIDHVLYFSSLLIFIIMFTKGVV